jgi:membrane-associated phospholipid phosphatase
VSAVTAARALSLVGHPAVLVPAAVVGAAIIRGAPPPVLQVAASAAGGLSFIVFLVIWVQVRRGRWTHVDASVRHERRQLNLLLSLLQFGTAALLAWSGQPSSVVAGLALCGGLTTLAYLLRGWLQLSLHAAFAMFATSLLWPQAAVFVPALLLTAGVSWSRLVLRRHTLRDVLAGLAAGGAAGFGFHLMAS